MNPMALLLGGAAAYLGYKVLTDKKESATNPALGQVENLELGKAYTVMHATNGQLSGVAAQYSLSPQDLIKRTMESAGFEVMSTPVFKDPQAASNFQQGKDTAWVYNVRRTVPEPKILAAPPTWSGMMQFYKLPIM